MFVQSIADPHSFAVNSALALRGGTARHTLALAISAYPRSNSTISPQPSMSCSDYDPISFSLWPEHHDRHATSNVQQGTEARTTRSRLSSSLAVCVQSIGVISISQLPR